MHGLIRRYRAHLPEVADNHIVDLQEGATPLIPLANLFPEHRVYVKYEGANPTGSFKDRGMCMAVSMAVAEGATGILCASTGNTSAAAAAYAARANLRCLIVIPQGKIAMGKLAQAVIYGATIIQIKGNFDDGMGWVKRMADPLGVTLVNSVNPYRLQGQKTAAFEIVDALGAAPDYHCLPVGNAGNISAYWMGYTEYHAKGKSAHLPKMLGYQAEGAAPLAMNTAFPTPETVATAIRIGNPQSAHLARAAVQESKGHFGAVSDEAILTAQQTLANREGIFCEPASAASIAGLMADIDTIPKGATIVCTLTGNGLKDADIVPPCEVVSLSLDAPDSVIMEQLRGS